MSGEKTEQVTCPACEDLTDTLYPAASVEWPLQCWECLSTFTPDEVRMCSDDKERSCDNSCSAFRIRPAARTVLKMDKTGVWSHHPTRGPVFAPFCDKHKHALVDVFDAASIEEPDDNDGGGMYHD